MYKNLLNLNENFNRYFAGLPSELLDSALTITVTGSLAHGLGTTKSDIDLLLITENPQTLNVVAGEYITNYINGSKGQIYVLTEDLFHKNINIFFSKAQIAPTSLSQIDLMNRLLKGIAVYKDKKYIDLIKSYNFILFEEIILLKLFSNVADIYEDLQGFLYEKKFLNLIHISNLLMSTCLDCVLTTLKDTYFRDKWKFSRLDRADLPNEIKKAYYSRVFSNLPEDSTQWVADNLYYCNNLILLAIFPNLKVQDNTNIIKTIPFYKIAPMCIGIKKQNKYFILSLNGSFEVDKLCLAIFLSLYVNTTFDILLDNLIKSKYFVFNDNLKGEVNNRVNYLVAKNIIKFYCV